MDTKLKNKHKLGIALIVVTITMAATILVALYPYIAGKAKTNGWESYQYYQDEAVDSTAVQLMNSVYSIWMEYQQQQAGHLLTPTQIFLPGLKERMAAARAYEEYDYSVYMEDTAEEDEIGVMIANEEAEWLHSEDYYERLQSFMDHRGELWKSSFRVMQSNLDYQMLDSDGMVLAESRNLQEIKLVQTEITFDSIGQMTIAYPEGEEGDDYSRQVALALNRYTDHDPVKQSHDYDYQYSGLQFERPKDVVFNFWLPEQLLTENLPQEDIMTIRMIRSYSPLQMILVILILAVAGIALILPAFQSLNLGQEKIFRAPFEVVSMVAAIGLIVMMDGELPAMMVAYTLNGSMAGELQEMNFALGEARELALVINGLLWAAAFVVVYWVITCYRAVFVLGLWGYIKERTFLGYFGCWLKRGWDRFYGAMQNVDFRDKSTKLLFKVVFANFLLLTIISCLWFFGVAALILYSIFLFLVLDKYWRSIAEKYELLLNAFHLVATGDFDIRIEENLGAFEPFRDELDTIQDGLRQAVDKEVQSQKMKTELITNVSHDLKTPLTAIITYVNLLKEDHITAEERASYIEVLEQKSMRLKVLIEDLFEVSKANSNNITLHPETVDVVHLMKQVRTELSDQLNQSEVDFRWDLPEEKIILILDGQKTFRIFENLLVNIAKYAMPGTRAYVDMGQTDERLWIRMRNISAHELPISGSELTERFVRGDESRNTEGSGLGLAIAKSFTEVQGGQMEIETEADLFRVLLNWPLIEKNSHQ